jgi:hypothetical protein
MTTASANTLLLLLLLALQSITHGYSVQGPIRKSPQSSTKSSSASLQHQSPTVGNIHRRTFLSIASASCLLLPCLATSPDPAHAKDVDPALKGTKADPAFQACLGQCMYECTKPKGSEQRSRAECLPECKSKCATSKEQLMTGTPLKKE